MRSAWVAEGSVKGGKPAWEAGRSDTSHDVVVAEVLEVPLVLEVEDPHDDDDDHQQEELPFRRGRARTSTGSGFLGRKCLLRRFMP